MTDAELLKRLREVIAAVDRRVFDDTTAQQSAQLRQATFKLKDAYLLFSEATHRIPWREGDVSK